MANRKTSATWTTVAAAVTVALAVTAAGTRELRAAAQDRARRALMLDNGGVVEIDGPVSRSAGVVIVRLADGRLASLQSRQVRGEVLLRGRSTGAAVESNAPGFAPSKVITNKDLPPAPDLPPSRVTFPGPRRRAAVPRSSVRVSGPRRSATRPVTPSRRRYANRWNELRDLRGEIGPDDAGGLNRIRVNRINRINRINRVNDLSAEGRRREKRLREILIEMVHDAR